VSNGLVTDDYGTLDYTYDDNGNITTITQDQQLIASYTYDGLNQLVREDNAQSGDSMVYVYDAGGNLLTKEKYDYTTGTLGAMRPSYVFGYDNTVWTDQMTDYDGTDLTYDAVGNMTDYGDNWHFIWDKGNQLTSVVFDLYNLTVSYKYDQNGMRTQKLMNGNVIMDYTYIGDRLISQTDFGGTTIDFIYDAMGDMIGVKYDGETYFYMRNLQGDVCGIYDSDGDLIVKYTYDAWGKRLNVTDANGVYISDLDSIAHVNPIRYRGYYYDSEFEFYYLQSRYYWPALGRFISADSLFMAGDALVGTNMYAYCSNSPVMYVDPSGMGPVPDMHMFGAALNVFVAAFLLYGIVDAGKAVVVLIVARNASDDDDLVYDFMVTFADAIMDMKEGETEGGNFSFVFNTVLLLTSKDVCTALGGYFDSHLNMSKTDIRNEIYFHAMVKFSYNNVKDLMTYCGYGDLIDDWENSADVTQLNTDGDSRSELSNLAGIVWTISNGM
jgi:RHS repeat-associated protein